MGSFITLIPSPQRELCMWLLYALTQVLLVVHLRSPLRVADRLYQLLMPQSPLLHIPLDHLLMGIRIRMCLLFLFPEGSILMSALWSIGYGMVLLGRMRERGVV